MNVLSPARPLPLHDLLGASFVFNSEVTALAWDRDFACFGLADGAVVILRAHWEGAPEIKPRAGGGAEIAAGTAPPPPPVIFKLHEGAVLALAGDALGGVVSGGADGFFKRLIDGEEQRLEEKPRRRIEAVAAGRGARRAFAAGRQVDARGPEQKHQELPGPVTALAYDPAGLHLAVGYEGGVSLEACGIRKAPRFEEAGAHTLLAWRPDGQVIAAAGPKNLALRDRAAADWQVVTGLAGPVTSIGFLPCGTLIAGGADFIQVVTDGVAGEALAACGPVACHPRFKIFAGTGADGAIHLRRPGVPGTMMIREPGPAVSRLAFSPDGTALAFATVENEAGTVILPDLLFRFGDAT